MTDYEPFISSDLDEFCNHHTGEYEQTDDLVDTPRGVEWRNASGRLLGILEGGTVDEMMHWVYINLK